MNDILHDPFSTDRISDSSAEICSVFGEVGRSAETGKDFITPDVNIAVPFSWEDYRLACREILGDQPLLPDTLLEAQRRVWLNNNLKYTLDGVDKVCLAVIPCTNVGLRLGVEEGEDITFEDYFHSLGIRNDVCVKGFGKPSNVFNVLPPEIQEALTFDVPKWDREDMRDLTDDDYKRFWEAYEKTFRKAQAMFDGEK